MRLSTWRPALENWLTQKITIDSWYLENPEVGKTHVFLPPLRDANYTAEQTRSIRGYAIQDILLVRRYPKELAYKDLPIASMEGVQSTLSLQLATEVEDIADLTRLEVLTVPDPVYIEELGDRLGDWLVRLHWAFSITFNAEAETDPVGTPITINGIEWGLHRESLDGATNVLDYEVKL